MISITAPHLDLEECHNDNEVEFAIALEARAAAGGWYAEAWLCEDGIIVSIEVIDSESRSCLRTLRADYRNRIVLLGTDETHQFATDLDPKRPDVTQLTGLTVQQAANAAADWFEHEIDRPICRYEWNRSEFTHREWILTDTMTSLVWSDSANQVTRPGMGSPDRIVLVSGTAKNK